MRSGHRTQKSAKHAPHIADQKVSCLTSHNTDARNSPLSHTLNVCSQYYSRLASLAFPLPSLQRWTRSTMPFPVHGSHFHLQTTIWVTLAQVKELYLKTLTQRDSGKPPKSWIPCPRARAFSTNRTCSTSVETAEAAPFVEHTWMLVSAKEKKSEGDRLSARATALK